LGLSKQALFLDSSILDSYLKRRQQFDIGLSLSKTKNVFLRVAGILMIVNACVFLSLGASILLLVVANVAGRLFSVGVLPLGIVVFTFLVFSFNLLGGLSFWRTKYSLLAIVGMGLTIFYCLLIMALIRVNFGFELIIVISSLAAVFTALSKKEFAKRKEKPKTT
jgi:hypothetical protein